MMNYSNTIKWKLLTLVIVSILVANLVKVCT